MCSRRKAVSDELARRFGVHTGIPPAAGVARGARECSEARLRDFDDLEVIVGDDGGDADQVVMAVGDPRVRYVRNEVPLGMAGNWGSALDTARGRYRALLMDDDVLLEVDRSLGIAFTDHYFDIGGRLRSRGRTLPGGRHDNCVAAILRHRPLVAVSAALMRAEVWEQVRPLPDLLNADVIMHLRAAEAG